MRLPMLRLLLVLTLYAWRIQAAQRIVHGPSNSTVRVGQIAVLRCQVAEQVGAVQWTKNGYGLGFDREMKNYPRYKMIGAISKGEYNLQIENVSVDDDGAYECQMLWGNKDNPQQVSAPGRLSVIAEPDNPTLGEQEKIRANEESPVHVKCTSKNGRPAARLVWVISLDAETNRIASYLNNASDTLKEIGVMPTRSQKSYEVASTEKVQNDTNGFYTITSEIDFVPSKDDDDRYLSCIALHPTYDGRFRAASAALSVSYKPKVQIQLEEASSDLREGGRAVFRCLIDAKPMQDLNVSWQGLEGRLKSGRQTAVIENLKMEDHSTQISCLARNSVGLTRASTTLSVNFAPRIISSSQTRIVNAGETVSFRCEAAGNPSPRIYWYRAGATRREEILGRGDTLTLDGVNLHHVGKYECIARTKDFLPSKLTHSLHIKGPPIMQLNEPAYLADDTIVLVCEVRGKPSPTNISWYKNGKIIDYNTVDHNRHTLRELSREFGTESTLTIGKARSSDYGMYNCSAWNEFGSRSATVELSEQTLWAKAKRIAIVQVSQIPWFVWLAIVGIVFFLILICCIRSCCCCCFESKNRGCCPRGDNLKPTKFSDCSDVTVRCEALDHSDGQTYFPDMFATSPPLDSSSELLHKDYVSIPQSNPDLDYLPPPVYGSYYQQPFGYSNTMEYSPNDNNVNHPSSTFGGYNSPMVGHEICVPVYNSNRNNFAVRQLNVAPLETLQEVDTPTADNGLLLTDNRAASRVSTHV